MTETFETKSASPADVVSALTELTDTVRNIRADTNTRVSRLERKHAFGSAARPHLAYASEQAAPYQKAFAAYVRRGDETALRAPMLEEKGMNTAVAADGGVLVDNHTSSHIKEVLRGTSSLRSVANIVQISGGSYDTLVSPTEAAATWTSETGSVSETAPPQFEKISIAPKEISASPQASQRMLDDAAVDVSGWLGEHLARRFSRAESAAFISGDGANQPKGILSHTTVGDGSWSWGNLGYVATGASGAFNTADPGDALVDLVYALPAGYRANATFMMNSKTAGAVRKLKDADGRYLWAESFGDGQPARLMGYAVLICEDMPDVAAGSFSIAFGDFNAGYTIVERPDMRILRDPYSAKPNVIFYATKRVGGDVTDFAAIKLLKFAAS